MQGCVATQGKAHPEDQPAPTLALEAAMAVGELALVGAKLAQLAARAIQRHQAVQHILELDAVGADVLHRRRADRAGNQAEVLQTGQPLLQGPLHEGMPGLAGLGLDQQLTALLAQQAPATAGHA
ncbi:hypothetical protein D3C78_1438390 [compost metagenome]